MKAWHLDWEEKKEQKKENKQIIFQMFGMQTN